MVIVLSPTLQKLTCHLLNYCSQHAWGLGIGADNSEAAGAGSRALSNSRAKEIKLAKDISAKKLPDKPVIPDYVTALSMKSRKLGRTKTDKIAAVSQYEANQFKSLKRNGIVPRMSLRSGVDMEDTI